MPIGRFIAMVGFLVWRRSDGRYLLLGGLLTRTSRRASGRPARADSTRVRALPTRCVRESMEELGH